jgi:hypothetical protein
MPPKLVLPGHPRFHAILAEWSELHAKKGADYGTDEDFLRNVRVSEQWGVPAWIGVAIRMTDKVTRLQSYARTGILENEGVLDSFDDLGSYAAIGRILLEEDMGLTAKPHGVPA